jgi:hypothetical protein
VPGIGDAARNLPDDAPVFSSRHARELLGWEARRTWRTELVVAGTENPRG